jgi:hypothetical protein
LGRPSLPNTEANIRTRRIDRVEALGGVQGLERFVVSPDIAEQDGAVAQELGDLLPGRQRMQPDLRAGVDGVIDLVPRARPVVEVFVRPEVAAGLGVLEVEDFLAIVPAIERVVGRQNKLERVAQATADRDSEDLSPGGGRATSQIVLARSTPCKGRQEFDIAADWFPSLIPGGSVRKMLPGRYAWFERFPWSRAAEEIP